MHSPWIKRTFLMLLNFFQIKEGDLISWEGGGPILQIVWIIWSPFCILILKVLRTQILYDSLDFNAFCLIQQYLSQSFEISAELKRRDQISGRGDQFCKKSKLFGLLFPLDCNFNSVEEANYSFFNRFQCIFHDWGVLLSDL